MYVREVVRKREFFQRKVVKKIHCCSIKGGIHNLKKVYSVYYFHPDSTWHETWAIITWNSNTNALLVVNFSHRIH
jgi:hypothetical protein